MLFHVMSVVKSQVERCVEVIELLAASGRPVPLGAIAERVDMPKSATHRMLAQLAVAGWVRQEAGTGFYALTMKVTITGQLFLRRTGLPDVYQPLLDDLAARTSAFARIAVLESGKLTWIGHAQGARAGLLYEPDLTVDVRLNVTATGKAWLACLSNEEAIRLIVAQGIGTPERFGPKARATIESILEELERTRARGWALTVEEAEAGVVAIAAAIRDPDDATHVVGTVSVAGPVARITPNRYDGIAAAVMATAGQLSPVWPLRERRGLPSTAHGAA
jgi:DNA-binding IclR family transcriptional regulator